MTDSASRRHLLSIDDLSYDDLVELLDLASTFAEVGERAVPKVPALRGRTVALAFFEDSTRTRLSFDLAAKRLSADVLSFAASGSSLSKGESLRDTAGAIAALGADALVVRHRNAGAPQQVARWLDAQAAGVAVINAGDGMHQHPTQALGDAFTLCSYRSEVGLGGEAWSLEGVHVGIVGDVAHSRVARSLLRTYTLLGAHVTLVAPPTLLVPDAQLLPPFDVAHNLDDVVDSLDVVSLLRLQRERANPGAFGSRREYVRRFGLTARRAAALKPHAVVMHPGPVNVGTELTGAADQATLLVERQVSAGVGARMAVLFWLLASQENEAGA